jgi:hypothetical protein
LGLADAGEDLAGLQHGSKDAPMVRRLRTPTPRLAYVLASYSVDGC